MTNQAVDNPVLLIKVEGPRLDAVNAPAFRDRVGALIDSGSGGVVLDMQAVDFIDSSGIGMLVGLLKRAGGRRDVVLATLTPAVQKAFKLTRMERIFQIFPDVITATNKIVDL